MRSLAPALVLVACLAIVPAACGGGDTFSATPLPSASVAASGTDAPAGDGPPGCLEAQIAFDAETNRLLLLNCVGQEGTGATTEQVWSWDGSAWTLVADDGPPAMLVTGVAYDTDRQVMVRYGGQPLTGTDCDAGDVGVGRLDVGRGGGVATRRPATTRSWSMTRRAA